MPRCGQGGAGSGGIAHQGGRAPGGGDLADMGVAVGAVTGDGHEQGARTRLTGIRDDTSDDTSIGAVIGAAGSTAGSGDLGKGAGNHAGVTGPHFASAASRMTGASL